MKILKQILTFTFLLSLAGCVIEETPYQTTQQTAQAADPTVAAWRHFVHASPFSYGLNASRTMESLTGRINEISLDDVDPSVAEHIRKVAQWTEDYPGYLSEANAAASSVYGQRKEGQEVAGLAGHVVGENMADKGNEEVGGFFGELGGMALNEMYARSGRDAAWNAAMRPLFNRAAHLCWEEYHINNRLRVASTNHLRNTLVHLRNTR